MHYTQTEVITIDPLHPDPAVIEHAATLIRAGELVVFPTETVYGLGADALQPRAVERIFATKDRPFSDPLIVHIAEATDMDKLAAHVPPQARQLARAFWPGPLTLILPANSKVPRVVTAGLESVAIRLPRHPIALALIGAVGSPVAAPSANRFMHVSPTTAHHVLSDLRGRVPLILDGGPCEVGVESTVLDLCSPIPTLLRPGGISLEALRTMLPEVQFRTLHATRERTEKQEEAIQKSPGQMLTHYAPSVPAFLFDGSEAFMRTAMLAEIQQYREQGKQVGVLVADEDVPFFEESAPSIYSLGSTKAPQAIAAHLYAGLRTLEEAGVQVILCRNFDELGLGLAIRDRLLKATGGNVFQQE